MKSNKFDLASLLSPAWLSSLIFAIFDSQSYAIKLRRNWVFIIRVFCYVIYSQNIGIHFFCRRCLSTRPAFSRCFINLCSKLQRPHPLSYCTHIQQFRVIAAFLMWSNFWNQCHHHSWPSWSEHFPTSVQFWAGRRFNYSLCHMGVPERISSTMWESHLGHFPSLRMSITKWSGGHIGASCADIN